MAEFDVAIRIAFSDHTHMRDLFLLSSRGEEDQVSGLEFIQSYFRADMAMISRPSGKGHVDGTKRIEQKTGTIHTRPGSSSVFIRCSQVGTRGTDHLLHPCILHSDLLVGGACAHKNKDKCCRKQQVLINFAVEKYSHRNKLKKSIQI